MKYLELIPRESSVIIRLKRGKANPLNYDLMVELKQTIADLQDNPEVRGAIITGQPPFFSAGLDVKELYSLERPAYREFLTMFRSMVRTIAAFSKPLVAAITGHAPAGGCILGICCDYRVMADGPYRIGLNEVPVGLYAHAYVHELYAMWVGTHQAYQALLEGQLFLPEEALAIGLLDEVRPMEEVLVHAERQLDRYLALLSPAWQLTKKSLRKRLIASFDDEIEETLLVSEALWWDQGGREVMGEMVRSLEKKT